MNISNIVHNFIYMHVGNTMLVVEKLAGVAPGISGNLHGICLCQVQIRLPTLALKPKGDVTRKSKTGISVATTKKNYVFQKLKKNYINMLMFEMNVLLLLMFSRD